MKKLTEKEIDDMIDHEIQKTYELLKARYPGTLEYTYTLNTFEALLGLRQERGGPEGTKYVVR